MWVTLEKTFPIEKPGTATWNHRSRAGSRPIGTAADHPKNPDQGAAARLLWQRLPKLKS